MFAASMITFHADVTTAIFTLFLALPFPHPKLNHKTWSNQTTSIVPYHSPIMKLSVSLPISVALVACSTNYVAVEAFSLLPTNVLPSRSACPFDSRGLVVRLNSASQQEAQQSQQASPPPAILNGKRVMPVTIIKAGLKGQDSKIAGVYALLSSNFQKGTEGWEAVIHVGVSQDLRATLDSLNVEFKHVRALSFSFPQPNAMQDVADDWKKMAVEAGAEFSSNVIDASAYLFDDDDDDDFDDDDDDWSLESVAQAVATVPKSAPADDSVVSPFEEDAQKTPELQSVTPSEPGSLDLKPETVDSVLNEVRPYLIADGGNVAVKGVDVETKTVFLQLEGACGSCPSSTVTMQMGIERVLKENFGPDVKVEQVEDEENKPTSLSMQMVQDEVDRIKPAITAMGGVVKVLSADADTGVVKLQFRGASRVQQGLELAIRDLPFVNAVQFVQFVTGEDD